MKVSKLIKTAILILAITAALSCLQLCMRVHNVQISQRSNAHLFLEDGTEYADTIPVELEGVYHYYPIHTGGNVDYIEIKAVASENKVEIFDALIVYNFLDRKWQWVMHNREEPEETQINQQAMFTNFNKKNRGSNASFLFCIDDIYTDILHRERFFHIRLYNHHSSPFSIIRFIRGIVYQVFDIDCTMYISFYTESNC